MDRTLNIMVSWDVYLGLFLYRVIQGCCGSGVTDDMIMMIMIMIVTSTCHEKGVPKTGPSGTTFLWAFVVF